MAPVYGSKEADSTIIVAARAYIQGMLSAGGDARFNQIYSSGFFSKSNLKAVLDVASWDMSPGHDPTKYDPSIFTTYQFLSCLKDCESLQGQLPAAGLDILQAKHLAKFLNHWFRSMDVKAKLQQSNFRRSVLGLRLERWGTLPNDAIIHGLWSRDSRTMTFRWLESLRSLLEPFQQMIGAARWKEGHGFVHIRERIRLDCSLPPHNTLLLDRLARIDQDHASMWQSGSYDITNFRPQEVPPHHFQGQFCSPTQPEHPSAPIQNPRRGKKAKPTPTLDFRSSKSLFCFAGQPVARKSDIVGLFRRVYPRKPMFHLKDPNGQSQLVCLGSAFPAPFNCCTSSTCSYRPKNAHGRPDNSKPRKNYLHVDLADAHWASLSPADWDEVIQFLKTASVAEQIIPSPALKLLLPTVSW